VLEARIRAGRYDVSNDGGAVSVFPSAGSEILKKVMESENMYLTVLQLYEFGEISLLCLDKLSATKERLTCDLPGLLLMVVAIRWSLELVLGCI